MTGHLWQARSRRGSVLPLVAISLVMLLSFVALAIDAGYIYVSRAQMQRAADAAALAGASALMEGEDLAMERAFEAAGRNLVGGAPVSEQEATVILGRWEWDARTFYPASGDPSPLNAVRVIGARPDVALFLAPVMGVDTTDVIKDATALAGSGICAGIWGLEGISARGDVFTDSYNSQVGPYGDANIHANGDLCSCQDIDLRGSVAIYGDAMYGEGYSIWTSGGAYEVWGIVAEHRCGDFVPDFDMDEAAVYNDNDTIGLTDRGRDPFRGSPWDLNLTSTDNLTLAGGTYYFTSAKMSGQATLTIGGPSELFVVGSGVFTGGGVTNPGQNPADLTIYSTGAELSLRGNAGFYGAVMAPATDVELTGTDDFYGTIVGRTVSMTGTADIHVDESLVEALFGLDPVAPILAE
jgi:Flp pilus assembly protein TadG